MLVKEISFYKVLIILISLHIAATILPIYLAWVNEWGFNGFFDEREEYDTEFYYMPFVRFQPYILGIVLGFVLHKLRHKKKVDLNIIANLWCWVKIIFIYSFYNIS